MELVGSMEFLRRVRRKVEEEHGKQYLEPLGTQTSLDGRQTTWIGIAEQFWCPYWTDSEEEIPLASFDDIPSISHELEREKKMVTKRGQLKYKTQKL